MECSALAKKTAKFLDENLTTWSDNMRFFAIVENYWFFTWEFVPVNWWAISASSFPTLPSMPPTFSANKWVSDGGHYLLQEGSQSIILQGLRGSMSDMYLFKHHRKDWFQVVTPPAKSTTPWKFHIATDNKPSQKRKVIFQPSFFRGYLKLRGGIYFAPLRGDVHFTPFPPEERSASVSTASRSRASWVNLEKLHGKW